MHAGQKVKDKYLKRTGVVVFFAPPSDPIVKWDSDGVETWTPASSLEVLDAAV